MSKLTRRTMLNPAALLRARCCCRALRSGRPTIVRRSTIAVQKVDELQHARRAARAVQCRRARVLLLHLEGLIWQELPRQPRAVPGLATEWRRIDDQTVELKLRQGVKFHNGDELTAEDVVFTFSRERMFGKTEAKSRKTIHASSRSRCRGRGKELPPEVPAVARRMWPTSSSVEAVDKYTVRFVNATPDVTLEGRLSRYGSRDHQPPRLGGGRELARLGAQADRDRSLQGREFRPDVSLTLEAHDEYWGGRPPLKTHALRRGAGGGEPRQRPALRRVPVRLRHPAGPDRRHRERIRASRCRAAPSSTTA